MSIHNYIFGQLPTSNSPPFILSSSWVSASGFFGTLSGVPNNNYPSTFIGVSGFNSGGGVKSMMSNAYQYISSDFDINYNFSSGAPATSYDPAVARQPMPADETALKIYLYKADNFIE